MLTRIECDKLIEKDIAFNPGLNVVVGDDQGANSIGKSTFLMIIDFAFGGETYLKHNKDVVTNIGDHHFTFSFTFNNNILRFQRYTATPEIVYVLNDSDRDISAITADEYRLRLSQLYGLSMIEASFRQIVSLYCRIWGKENDDVFNPLLDHPKQSSKDAVLTLMKVFDTYEPVSKLEKVLAELESQKHALNQAFSHSYINEINKTQYVRNGVDLAEGEKEISSIQNDLRAFALSIQQVTDRNVLTLKKEKDELARIQTRLLAKKQRLEFNLDERSIVSSALVKSLGDFFPGVNLRKIGEIERFHSGIKRILKAQITEEMRETQSSLGEIQTRIEELNADISARLSDVENPEQIIERVVQVSTKVNQLRADNAFYEMSKSLDNNCKRAKIELSDVKDKILSELQFRINQSLVEVSEEVQGSDKKAPEITFEKSSYNFRVFEDTGTGKAYIDLVVLDLVIAKLAKIPILIHDSYLHKNIANPTVESVFSYYKKVGKQVFVSIDELPKFSKQMNLLVNSCCILQLSDSRLLFNKDWRVKKNPTSG